MSDYNQLLLPPEAVCRARALDGEGLAWIEEPVRADDYAGCARVAAAAATPIQIGENAGARATCRSALDAAACGPTSMPDLVGSAGSPAGCARRRSPKRTGSRCSTHLFPEVSAHLMVVTPTAHWLEYVDWASPILEAPLEVRDGAGDRSRPPGQRARVERGGGAPLPRRLARLRRRGDGPNGGRRLGLERHRDRVHDRGDPHRLLDLLAGEPASRSAFSCAAMHLPQPLIAETASDHSSKSSLVDAGVAR